MLRKIVLGAAALLSLSDAVFAQTQTGPVDARNFGATAYTSANGATARTLAARGGFGSVYDVRDYGAKCDGSSHTVSAVLGVSTISGLAAYAANGGTPYSWINNGNQNVKVAMRLRVPGASSATVLAVDSVAGVPTGATISGTQIPTSPAPTASAVASPSAVSSTLTGSSISTTGVTSIPLTSAAGITAGSQPIPQAGLWYDDYVASVASNTLTLKYGSTGSIGTGTSLTFQPPSTITLTGAGLTGTKPSIYSAASTASSNYYVYAAWSLTDTMVANAEMDWLAIQAAIQAASASTSGGVVQLPSGKCMMDNSTVAGSGAGTLLMPASTGGLAYTNSVNLVGNGLGNTFLSWPYDLGVGRAAITYGPAYATFDNGLGHYSSALYFGDMGYFAMLGPNGYSEPAVGTRNVRMNGVISGSRRQNIDMTVAGFNVGMTMEGVDHTRWQDLYFFANVNALRMGASSVNLFGNDVFDHIEVQNSSMANVSVDPSAIWVQSDIRNFYSGETPKGFVFEQGPTGSYSQPAGATLQSSTWDNILMEGIGLCAICDDNLGPNVPVVGAGGYQPNIQGMTITHLNLASINSTYQPAGSTSLFWMQLTELLDTKIDFVAIPFQAGMIGGIFIDGTNYGTGGSVITGPMTNTLSGYGTVPFIYPSAAFPYGQMGYSLQVCERATWCGHIVMVNDSTSRALGMPMEYTTGVNGDDLSVRATTGAGPFAGINMMNGTTNGRPTIVAMKMCGVTANGAVPTLPTSGTATANHYATLATGGTITNAAASNSANVIGMIMQVTGSAARVNVGPMGACD